MNFYKLFFIVIMFFVLGCKKNEVVKEEIRDYYLEADKIIDVDRNVSIDISEAAKSALNYLIRPIRIQSPCDYGNKELFRDYKLDFYFQITNERKVLIIIIDWNRSNCGFMNSSVVKSVIKYTIPIDKIDILEKLKGFPSLYISTEPNHSTVSLDMDYSAKLIGYEYVSSRFPFEDLGNQSQNKIEVNSYNESSIQIEMTDEQADNFIKSLKILIKEFKK